MKKIESEVINFLQSNYDGENDSYEEARITLSIITYYISLYYSKTIKKDWIFLQTQGERPIGDNLLAILKVLDSQPDYSNYTVYVTYTRENKALIEQQIEMNALKNVTMVYRKSYEYAKVLALAKYVFTDNTLPSWYTKKEGQVLINAWANTALKKIGRDNPNTAYNIGRIQKTLFSSDYILCPSEYMAEVMPRAYCLENLYQGKLLGSGYPKNSYFLDKDVDAGIREELNLDYKKVYGYIPAWRGTLHFLGPKWMTSQLEYYLVRIDEMLEDDEVMLVYLPEKIHDAIDFTPYTHIKAFPEEYTIRQIMKICDVLVTDYARVFIDYANTNKKTILFVYDKEYNYDEDRYYASIDELPFPQVHTVQELIHELRTPKNYDDTEFKARFCTYEGIDSAERVCRHVIKGEKVCKELSVKNNGKPNVLIYTGGLARNGLTTALLNLLANIDTDKYNYCVSFRASNLKETPERVSLLPEELAILPIASTQGRSVEEEEALLEYFVENRKNGSVLRKVDRFYKRLYQRNFGKMEFEHIIHYTGYDKDIINMFLQAPVKRGIFVHSDMIREIETRGNQHRISLERAYHNYDKVAPVTVDIVEPTITLGKNKKNVQVVNSTHDYKSVLAKAELPIEYQKETESTVTIKELEKILDSNAKKFITVGRFSPEKCHKNLMKAFEQYYKKNPNSYLIIIGGHGELYEETLIDAKISKAHNNIVIIKSILNPMPILKKCDLFILSSLYEGLGLVILEADTLGVPVISTDIVGPRGFMQEHGGYLVPCSAEGILEGMKAFDEGKVKVMNVDFEEHNKKSVQMFENLF